MKNLRLSVLALFVIGLFVVSCSKEDETPAATDETVVTDDNTDDTTPIDTTIVVGDTTFMIMENSEASTSIGTLVATTNHGSVTFSIKSQSIDGALSIDENSGEVTVGDASAYDYETNTSLTAVVSVMNGSKTMDANVTVDLENEDVFLASLTDSKSAYESASDGDWVIITQAEYEALGAIKMVHEAGMKTSVFPNTVSSLGGGWVAGITLVNTGDSVGIIPSGGMVYAFKYYLNNAIFNQIGAKVKVSSTANDEGFESYGNALPDHTGLGIHYFIYKGGMTPASVDSYLGTYQLQNSANGKIDGLSSFYEFAETSGKLGSTHGNAGYYQALSTTKVQW